MPHLENPKLEVLRSYAKRYGLLERTCYRYQSQGVDLSDPCAVAMHISNLKHPAPKALNAISKILRKELNQ